MLHGIIIQII